MLSKKFFFKVQGNIVAMASEKAIGSGLGQDKGYTVNYSPLSEGTSKGKGLYLTVYLKSSPILYNFYE